MRASEVVVVEVVWRVGGGVLSGGDRERRWGGRERVRRRWMEVEGETSESSGWRECFMERYGEEANGKKEKDRGVKMHGEVKKKKEQADVYTSP